MQLMFHYGVFGHFPKKKKTPSRGNKKYKPKKIIQQVENRLSLG